jgi:phage gp29-like protein
MEIMENWHDWKKTLGKAVDLGESVGMSEKTITNLSEKVGTYLSNNVHPHNDEERLLKEMWDAADDEDRNVLAKIVVKIVDK